MGKLSKMLGLAKKGKISIAIDKPSFIAENSSTGLSSSPSRSRSSVMTPTLIRAFIVPCVAVVLKATGKEKVEWEELSGEGLETDDCDREHKFLEEKVERRINWIISGLNTDTDLSPYIVICAIPHILQPGEYSYPFQYQLPPTLPGVFSLKSYDNFPITKLKASIDYKFKATLEVDGFFSRDLKDKTHVIVHEQLTKSIHPSEDSTTRNVNWLCCFNQGDVHALSRDGQERVLPRRDSANNSEVEVLAMRCHLYQDITLKLKHCRQTFKCKIAEATFLGVSPKTTVNRPQPLFLAPTVEDSVMSPSTSGEIIQCAYRIEIECDIPWCPDVQLHLPVTIMAPVLPLPISEVPLTAGYIPPVVSSI